jgi:hypothetical protein
MKEPREVFASELTRLYEADAIDRVMDDHRKIAPGWYAESATIGIRTGPHSSEKSAREYMRLTERARARQRIRHKTDYPYPYDLRVWRETKREKSK